MPRFVISAFDKLRRYSSYHERTPDRVRGRLFCRWYDRDFDFVALNKAAITQVIAPEHQQALVIDASFIPKSSTHTYGLERFWNSRQRRSEKGLEVSAVAWLDITDNCAYGLLRQAQECRAASDTHGCLPGPSKACGPRLSPRVKHGAGSASSTPCDNGRLLQQP